MTSRDAAHGFVDPDQVTTSRSGMDYTPPKRTGAFKAAGRHSSRVRFLKRAIVLGSVFGVSIIAIVAAFDPFRHLPKGISIGGVGVKGTKITMDSPKISGVQQGGGPYSIQAKQGIQDITKPTVVELVGVDAHVQMADTTKTHILSSHGIYDSKVDLMKLDGDVKISNTSGYTFSLKTAAMNFRDGIFSSEERMRVDLKGGDVMADSMRISDNGHKIVFQGHIDSTFDPPDEEPAAAGASQAPSADVLAATPDEARP